MSRLEAFARAAYGADGEAWLRRLPALVDTCARRWGLRVGARLPADYNWVASAVRADGSPVVLKLGVSWEEGLRGEAAALRAYDGRGAVRLLEADEGLAALLVERAVPGSSLEPLVFDGRDDEATLAAAGVMRRLWRAPRNSAPAVAAHDPPATVAAHDSPATVAGWGAGFARHRAAFGGAGPLAARLFARGEALFAELCASAGEAVLLHGDLHHFNVLSAEREPWLAIDPKGVVGERDYEPGALLRNPYPRLLSLPATLTARRLDVLADALGLDRGRIRDWAFAQAVLSAVWHVEDEGFGDGARFAMACAELLERA